MNVINKYLLVAEGLLLLALLGIALADELRIAGIKAKLASQTARADAAEARATALQGVNAFRAIQLSALQGQAAQCEEARRREAANAAMRRAILGPARAEQRQSAQGGIASPRVSNQGEKKNAARRAVAARLNRPL